MDQRQIEQNMKSIRAKLVMHKSRYRMNTLAVLTGGASASASMIIDTQEADAIFEAARTANGNFTNMSDSQIVDYCSNLDTDQLTGMVSLVHGRHFENLVSDATGGVLFDAKNHPDTDMTLDGTEYSIKSNDSTADGITEFDTYSPQDLGMDDKELIDRTSEVLDGDIIDASDAIISGAIGFGTMATLQAVGEGAEEWENLNDWEKTKTKAAWVGTKTVGKAGVGTAKSTLALGKLGWKGIKAGYKAHKEFKSDGGYERLREDMKKI